MNQLPDNVYESMKWVLWMARKDGLELEADTVAVWLNKNYGTDFEEDELEIEEPNNPNP